MTTKEKKRLKARMAIIQRQWEWQQKQKGYTVYRHNKPAYDRKPKRRNPLIGEVTYVVGAAILVCLLLAV